MNRSAAREMCYTGGDYSATQMKEWGYLSRVFETPDELLAESRKMAQVRHTHRNTHVARCEFYLFLSFVSLLLTRFVPTVHGGELVTGAVGAEE